MKVLFTAKVDSHIKHFHLPFLKMFKNNGYEVHVASEGSQRFESCDVKYNITFGVNPFSVNNLKNYRILKNIISTNRFDIIHTHTPVASVLTRLAAYSCKRNGYDNGTVIYTAHGFHFIRGGSILSWILYFPIEFLLSKITDKLILINNDDFNLATKFKMGNQRYMVPGVGVDFEHFSLDFDQRQKDKYIITSIGEINKNKNQKLLVDAISLFDNTDDLEVRIVGDGNSVDELNKFIHKKNIENVVSLLGYRNDIPSLIAESNLMVSTSKREGLPINIIESMAMKKPIIVTNCRGHNDLIINEVNGLVTDYSSKELFHCIHKIKNDRKLAEKLSEQAFLDSKKYGLTQIKKVMSQIYGIEDI